MRSDLSGSRWNDCRIHAYKSWFFAVRSAKADVTPTATSFTAQPAVTTTNAPGNAISVVLTVDVAVDVRCIAVTDGNVPTAANVNDPIDVEDYTSDIVVYTQAGTTSGTASVLNGVTVTASE